MDVSTILAIGLSAVSIATVLAFIVIAIVEVMREKRLDEISRVLWILALVFLPVGGVLLWFALKPRGLRELARDIDRLVASRHLR